MVRLEPHANGKRNSKTGNLRKSSATIRRPGQPRSPQKRGQDYGSDVIAFTDSINSGFSSAFFGEQKKNSVRALLIAGIESFAEKGFHGTTTRDIAKRAGMSPAALYVHFKTKKELLHKLTVVTASAMLHDLTRANDPQKPPADRLRDVVATYVKCNARMHTVVHVATFEFGSLDREQRKSVVAIRRQVEEIFLNCLEAGRAAGEFDFPDAQLLRVAIMSLCISVSRWFSADGPMTPEELGDTYADLVLKMVT